MTTRLLSRRILVLLTTIVFAVACGSGGEKKTSAKQTEESNAQWKMKTYISGDLGPLDVEMATVGKEIFDLKCTACHSMDTRLVGPPLSGVTERRSSNWLMNIMLHNEEMVVSDPDAIEVFEQYNKALMLVDDFYEEDARKVLEYMRMYDMSLE